jgi:hypothetical protein
VSSTVFLPIFVLKAPLSRKCAVELCMCALSSVHSRRVVWSTATADLQVMQLAHIALNRTFFFFTFFFCSFSLKIGIGRPRPLHVHVLTFNILIQLGTKPGPRINESINVRAEKKTLRLRTGKTIGTRCRVSG